MLKETSYGLIASVETNFRRVEAVVKREIELAAAMIILMKCDYGAAIEI